MTLTHILIFSGLALLVWAVACSPRPAGWGAAARRWALLVISGLALFWMQPSTPVRWLDFWLPVATLALAVIGWAATRKAAPANTGESTQPLSLFSLFKMGGAGGGQFLPDENILTASILAAVALLVALTRYLPIDTALTPSRPPQIGAALIGLLAVAGLALLAGRASRRMAVGGLMVLLLGLFVVIKTPALAELAAAGLRTLVGQQARLAAAADLRWLGFSYLAFRLIHTARDRQSGRLPDVTLREYVTYAVFFPALTAGPIDRLERFLKDLRAPAAAAQGWGGLLSAGERLTGGLVRKFVLADALAMIALNGQNAGQVEGAGWAWLLAGAYSLMIYLDFSGYSDIAIGIGLLLGVKLPENFNAPYLKPNLTQFWNSWHITLTQWFRAYYFNPVTRWLRGVRVKLPRKAAPSQPPPFSRAKMGEGETSQPASILGAKMGAEETSQPASISGAKMGEGETLQPSSISEAKMGEGETPLVNSSQSPSILRAKIGEGETPLVNSSQSPSILRAKMGEGETPLVNSSQSPSILRAKMGAGETPLVNSSQSPSILRAKMGEGETPGALPAPLIIFLTQISTMLLIGLWHGVTWNFVIWGVWHGLGLFVHNRWSEFARGRFAAGGAWARIQPWVGAAATFGFVTLGWVWFALPTPRLALRVLAVMFGG